MDIYTYTIMGFRVYVNPGPINPIMNNALRYKESNQTKDIQFEKKTMHTMHVLSQL